MATLASVCQWVDDVIAGDVVACEWTIKACRRFLSDLESGKWTFDSEKATRVLEFFPDYVRHVKGKMRGQPYELSDWEGFIAINLFGFVDENGLRRFRTAYIEVARKNSKSTFCSGLALYMTAFDLEGGAEVFSAATTRSQARIVFGDAQEMIRKSPPLKKVFGVHSLNIHHTKSGSKFEPLSSDAHTLDGLNVHCGILDELHAHKTREVFDVVETATAAREQPLLLSITTAGTNKLGVCYEQRTYVTQVLNGTHEDDSYFGIIFTLDKDDDPFDEANWPKANPNLGRAKKWDDMRRLAKKARQMPTAKANFLTKHLNVWVNAGEAWMDMDAWEALEYSGDWDDLAGLPCYVGLDLSNKRDIAAMVAAFVEGDKVHFIGNFYLPEDQIDYKPEAIGGVYKAWGEQEHLILTEGNVIDHEQIEVDLRDWLSRFDVKAVAYDPWGSVQLATRLEQDGAPMFQVQQSTKNLSEAMKELEVKVVSGKLLRPESPVMDWMMSNVVARIDRNENLFPNKEHPDNKIDGVIALLLAMNRIIGETDPDFDELLHDLLEIEV